jgi:hypothetical protein
MEPILLRSEDSVRKRESADRAQAVLTITRCHTLVLPQREKRVNTLCQLPNSGGRSRQGEPVRATHSMASTNKRWSP